MEKEIRIQIVGMHGQGEDRERVETLVEAQYYKKNEKHFFLYEEKQEHFDGKVKSQIIYKDGVLQLKRKGVLETEMVFEEGKEHDAKYPTPAGVMRMGIKTGKIKFVEERDQIQIFVEYTTRLDDEFERESILEITAEGKKNGAY